MAAGGWPSTSGRWGAITGSTDGGGVGAPPSTSSDGPVRSSARSATLADLKAAIGQADLTRLKQIVAELELLRGADAKVWRQVFDGGVLAAVLTRRLVLGGRE